MVGPGGSGAAHLPEEILAPCLKHLQGLASSPHIFIHLLQKGGSVAQPVLAPTEASFFPQFPWTLKKCSRS